MDIVDLTCEQTEADSTIVLNDDNIVLLDMIDVCCEVDVGDALTSSNDDAKAILSGSGAGFNKLSHNKSQPAPIKFISDSSREDFWGIDPESDIDSHSECLSCAVRSRTIMTNNSTQTNDTNKALMSVEDFRNKPDIIYFYTGLKSYDRLMHIFHTLEPECHELIYRNGNVETLNVLDQMFLTLIKLRSNKDDFELSLFFDISLESVKNVFETWVIFLHKMWTQVDFWLPKELIVASMPTEFKNMFPTARVVVDCLELLISKPVDDKAQLATWSSNISDHTLKILVGVTPSGSVSFCSEAFGGGTSESEMFELLGILNKLEPNDAVIVDKRFDIGKMCLSKEVTVHTLNLKKVSGYRFSLCTDKLKYQSYPVKNLGHLLEGYKILSQKLNNNLLPLASELCYVCVMLNNFLDD